MREHAKIDIMSGVERDYIEANINFIFVVFVFIASVGEYSQECVKR